MTAKKTPSIVKGKVVTDVNQPSETLPQIIDPNENLDDLGGMAILNRVAEFDRQRKKLMDTPYKCGKLSIRGIEVQSCKNLLDLGTRLALVYRSKQDYDEVMTNSLNLTIYPEFKFEGHLYEDIEHDIKLRMNFIIQEEQTQTIEEIRKIAERYVTPKEKRDQDMQKMMSLMSKLAPVN